MRMYGFLSDLESIKIDQNPEKALIKGKSLHFLRIMNKIFCRKLAILLLNWNNSFIPK